MAGRGPRVERVVVVVFRGFSKAVLSFPLQ